MDKSKQISRRTWILIAKNLIVLSVLVAVTLVGARSWFTAPKTAGTTGVSIRCKQPEDLEIAVVAPGAYPQAGDWINGGEVALDKPFLNNLKFTNMTGDGVELISPYISQQSGMAYADTGRLDRWETAEENKSYMSFDLYMRTKTPNKTVAFEGTTKLEPVSTDQENNYVIGAARLAVLNKDYECEFIWIPAPQIYYDFMNHRLYTNAAPGNTLGRVNNADINFRDGTYNHAYYDSSGERHVLTAADGVIASTTGNYTLGTKQVIADLGSTLSNGYYINHVTVNVWVEGEDSESCARFVDGQFKLTLDLNFAV